ncbi:MAG: alanine racemase [Bacillota bacterium]
MNKWIEVDLNKLEQNVRMLQDFFSVPVMAVIKQNAYGLGAVEMGLFLESLGIKQFAVTSVRDGIVLRNGGLRSTILVYAVSYSEESQLADLWRYKLTPSVYSLEFAEALNKFATGMGRPIDVHVKVDTGMGRMGFSPAEMLAAAERLKELGGLRYGAIFTHYSNAFENSMNYTRLQMDRFMDLVRRLEDRGLVFPVKYSANSMAALKFPETHMDMVNIGSAFLGNSVINPEVPLVKIYRCRVRVLQVRTLEKGSFVGYSNTYRAKRDIRVAVLPIGYSDGFGLQKKIDSFRPLDFLREMYHLVRVFIKPGGSVFFRGRPLKIIGKTSMQLSVVEIGDLPVQAGDILDVDLNPLWAGALVERVYTGADSAVAGMDRMQREAAATTLDDGAYAE